jgi:hypothetical protein
MIPLLHCRITLVIPHENYRIFPASVQRMSGR